MISAYEIVGPHLVELGYSAIPTAPGTKAPGELRHGHWRPTYNWGRYANRLPTHFDMIVFLAWKDAGVGLVVGPAGGHVGGIDIDTDDTEVRGAILSAIPQTTVIKRGAKGETRFFRLPQIKKSKSWRCNGLQVCDLIGPGRQTVLPPTIHPSTGQPYRWIGPDALDDMAPEDLPELRPDHITAINEALRPFGYSEEVAVFERGPSETLECSDVRGREHALAALNGCAAELAYTQEGSRNTVLNGIAYKLGRKVARGWLSVDEVCAALWAACIANGLLDDDGQGSVRATLWSGLTAGMKRPAPDPRERLSDDPEFAARIRLKVTK